MSGLQLRFGVYGLALGFALSQIGFSSFDEVHSMFTFADFRLVFVFAGAVGLTGLAFALLHRGHHARRSQVHPGTVIGAVLFGTGWAVTGACPAIALVQIGEGQAPAAVTMAGIVFGAWLFRRMQGRVFRWKTGSCEM